MKKSFTVHFPFKQSINPGMSWAQINELSWEEVNLLSWYDLTNIAKRYIDYSIQFTQKLAHNINFTLKKVFTVR